MPLASRSTRLVGQFIDGFVGLLIFIPAGLFMLTDETLGAMAMVTALIFYLAYLLFADAMPGGQSFGKRMLGIAVVDRRTLQPCSAGQSFVRNLLLMFLGFFDWIFILGETKRRLGDIVAGTIVVRANALAEPAGYRESAPVYPV